MESNSIPALLCLSLSKSLRDVPFPKLSLSKMLRDNWTSCQLESRGPRPRSLAR